MKSLLLAAGKGTRLKPITDHIPKCLVPINGKPLLGIWLELLVTAKITEILINTHYLPEAVNTYLNNSPYRQYITSVYESELLGTGGTLLRNRSFFGDEPVMLIHADNLSSFDLPAFIKSHQDRPLGTLITMMTFETDSPETCGIVETDKSGIVVAFHEKVSNPPGKAANGAVYIIEPEIFSFLESLNNPIIDFSLDVIPKFIGRIFTFKNTVYHRDIGNPASYALGLDEFSKLQAQIKNN